MNKSMVRKFYSPEPASPAPAAPAAAPAPAASAPAAPAAAPAPSAPAAPRMMFGLPVPAPKDLKPAAPAPTAPAAPTSVTPGSAAPAAPAPTSVTPGASAPAAPAIDPLDAPFARPLMGRHATPRAAEEALIRSENEAKRLYYEELRPLKDKYQKETTDLNNRIIALQQELETARTTPAFKELSKEEFDKLKTDDPVAAADYLTEKRFRERDAQMAKEQRARELQQQQEAITRVKQKLDSRVSEMQSHKDDFPLYTELQPAMDAIIEETRTFVSKDGSKYSPLTGHEWTADVLYDIALGRAYRQALQNGRAVQAGEAEKARLAAQAAATAAGQPAAPAAGTGSGAAAADPAAESDKAYKDAIRSSGQKHRFLANRR